MNHILFTATSLSMVQNLFFLKILPYLVDKYEHSQD